MENCGERIKTRAGVNPEEGIREYGNVLFADPVNNKNPIDTPEWQARLAENKLGGTKPQAPVYMYHGIIDEIVPLRQAAQLRRTWCNRGANVTWSLRPGEHAITLVEGYNSAANWLDARFDGSRAWSNCWLP